MPEPKLNAVAVLNRYFGQSKRLTQVELKSLTHEERIELAKLAAVELGVELELK